MRPLLEVDSLSKHFGGIRAIADLSMTLAPGELLCIIGPNGCGKSTLFNLITGAFSPDTGRVRFRGEDITGLSPYRIARRGIGRKFQVPTVYGQLSLRENLAVPLFAEAGQRGLRGLFARRPANGVDPDAVLELIGLAGRAQQLADELPHGAKQWLEIGMLLASRPVLMLLDEPTAGMTEAETEATAVLIRRIRDEHGVAIVVIEHDLGFVRRLDCPIAVMLEGRFLCRGDFETVRANPLVREAYLGRKG